jgi:NAD(P)-dependent dehydrogenase (short-subunit alcohol dehydrogenase family)
MSQSTKTEQWAAADVPDQTGRTAVVTGANSGIGFEAAKVLAERGATVVLACRDLDKAKQAAERIKTETSSANVDLLRLDLSSLASIRQAAEELRTGYDQLDLLINNAGVMWIPHAKTADGFELQFGTNHLGHFALTGLVLDKMLLVSGSRIVTISSLGHRIRADIHLDDLQSERRYDRIAAYGQSKLANLMFTYELQRRLAAAGAETIAVAAHPGGASTDLVRNSPAPVRALNKVFGSLVMQSAAVGALPTLRAATDPEVAGGEYYGPGGPFEQWGYPKRVRSSARSHDAEIQRRLWSESERLTGVTYSV